MRITSTLTIAATALSAAAAAWAAWAAAPVRQGDAAYGDWRTDSPGVTRHILAGDLPKPFATSAVAASPETTPRPPWAPLHLPPGFAVSAFARLEGPRQIRIAANGDIFVAETDAGRISILRAPDGAPATAAKAAFAEGLDRPFGIAFYPAGPHPQWVYVAENNAVVRFPYRPSDLKPSGPPQTVVAQLAESHGGHSTRDVAFSPDGRTMFVSVGSGSNIAEGLPLKSPAEIAAWQAGHAPGATWGRETDRADVLAFDPDGKNRRVFATGLRNCVTLTVQPGAGNLWCVVNERDGMGDNLPPDYATRVRQGGYYGWPWYYIGSHPDDRVKPPRPDLAGKAIVPDVLIQPHSAPLGMTFYQAASGPAAFPAPYRGDAFVTLHGSWNRKLRTGYKLVRLKMRAGAPTGEYEDFMTGFVIDDHSVWGRPVGVAEARDGALLVTDDGSGMVWRIAPVAARAR